MRILIPAPVEYSSRPGEFKIDENTTIYSDIELEGAMKVFISLTNTLVTDGIKQSNSKEDASIVFIYDATQKTESYRLDVKVDKVSVYASSFAGAFYATQTMRQLLSLDTSKSGVLDACKIKDAPSYSWRGILLDESRHFFGKEFVKKLIDLLAFHKMNILHWHLTDNEGWRIEIKKYPKLTEIGSKRKGTQYMAWGRRDAVDWTPYGGFYTQDEIKEIVEYALNRNVSIVPEIDMPAHFGAVLAAYPELGCRGVKIETPIMHGGVENGPADLIACAGKRETYQFIFDIIDELSDLFPAPYFHIGGDEAPKSEWKKCRFCQDEIKKNRLKGENELQGHFNNKISDYLKTKEKTLIGWNEILKRANLNEDVIAQYWTPMRDRNVEKRIASGQKIIISKHQCFYFDMPYAVNNLKETYNFTPEKYHIQGDKKNILGFEGTLWTEWISTEERLLFQLFPRLEALSELAWTIPENRDYDLFLSRLTKFLPTLDALGVDSAPLSLVDSTLFDKLKIGKIFHLNDAHVEYRKAMSMPKTPRNAFVKQSEAQVREYFKNDKFCTINGIVVDYIKEDTAVCSVRINQNHLNALGTVQGGLIFTLADFTFAVHANSTGNKTVLRNADITYLRPAKASILKAIATQINCGKTTCVYNVEIYTENNDFVAYAVLNGHILNKKV
ncbi:MAG: family 20 glycosylhydrolase [Christensenellaceae bacterium]|jgi:hexosaminidase|nr:family 20 glycosylhydrolase [Christensenellaceae bacterium]